MRDKIRFGDLYAIASRNGLTKPSKIRGNGYKMINMGELFANDRIYDVPMELVPLKENEQRDFVVNKNDLLFARQSLVLSGAGKCSIVMEVSTLTVFESHLIRVRLKENLADPLFYYYYFRSAYSPISTIVSQCAQAGIRGSDLSELLVLYPHIETQHRIADILSAYDDLIENNRKQIKLLEEAAQRLYKEWFVDLRFPGHEDTAIVDGVPEGWHVLKFSEVFDYVRGKSYSSKELSDADGILMVNLKNIRAFGGYKRNVEKRYIGQYNINHVLHPGDIIMGVTDMTSERRLVGHVAIVPNFGQEAIFSMDLIKLVPKRVSGGFLYSAMFYGGYSERIAPLANGVNVLHLKPEAMMSMEMLIPAEKTISAYDAFFRKIQEKIEALEAQNNLASEARDRLLPKLMSGEIEV